MRRVATGFVALLVGLTTVAGVVAADARRDHDRAPVTITAVQQPEGTSFASYEPGSWGKTVFVLLVGSDERCDATAQVVGRRTAERRVGRRHAGERGDRDEQGERSRHGAGDGDQAAAGAEHRVSLPVPGARSAAVEGRDDLPAEQADK